MQKTIDLPIFAMIRCRQADINGGMKMERTYKIEKLEVNKNTLEEQWSNGGGGYTEADVKMIVKGHKKDKDLSDENRTIYSRFWKNKIVMWFVTEE